MRLSNTMTDCDNFRKQTKSLSERLAVVKVTEGEEDNDVLCITFSLPTNAMMST